MANRAVKYADAVVVPTHAVADELDALLGFGDRLRVLNGAVSSRIARPDDAAARVTHLELPDRYLATVGNSGAQHGIGFLLAALAAENATTLPLVVVGTEREPGALAAAIAESGLDPRRVVGVGPLDDEDYSSVLAGAVAMIYPGIGNGFGTPMLEAMALGTPVVHAATPSLIEVAGESGVSVPFSDPGAYPGLLAEAIDRVAEDQELRTTLSILGLDRARLFTWRAAAEGVWQLHADL
jgi:glycosyltransferase involved in cell wall biosynthesis